MTERPNERLDAALTDAATAQGPTSIALMRILIEASSEAAARAGFERALALRAATADRAGVARLRAALQLWDATPRAWQVVRSTIDGIAHTHRDGSPSGMLRYWAEAFDRLATHSPEASVALYSLGSPALLAASTAEVVDRMNEWGVLAADRDALDIGCGIGRFLVALAPRLRSLVGFDISARMVAEASARCAALPNVRVAQTAGQDLADVAGGSMDLVLAADVLPYMVQAGTALVAAMFGEIARVLRPGGRLLVLNYSYRGDPDQDRRDARSSAEAAGLHVIRDGTRDLESWDALAFLFAKPQAIA